MPILKAGANAITKLGQPIGMVENVTNWLSKKLINYCVVVTMVEAEATLAKWKRLKKPKNMIVDLAPGLITDEESNTRSVLTKNGGR
jgi:hypothetical protein